MSCKIFTIKLKLDSDQNLKQMTREQETRVVSPNRESTHFLNHLIFIWMMDHSTEYTVTEIAGENLKTKVIYME